jgi:hypothetical protein
MRLHISRDFLAGLHARLECIRHRRDARVLQPRKRPRMNAPDQAEAEDADVHSLIRTDDLRVRLRRHRRGGPSDSGSPNEVATSNGKWSDHE